MPLQKQNISAVIRSKLEQSLGPQLVEITDISHKHSGHAGARPEGETHFELRIVAERFRGLSRIERHRLIHEVLREEMGNPIHALAILQADVPA